MSKDFEKSEWVIDLKGYFPEMVKESWSGEYFTDLVYGTRTISFTGTREELDRYIDKLESPESQLKIIGILNKADTLVEFRRIFDLDRLPTSKITISDVFNQRSWIFDSAVAGELLPDKDRIRFFDTLKDSPSRRFIRKDILDEFILANLKNNEK